MENYQYAMPCLTYGCECLSLNNSDKGRLESAQGVLVKQCMGLSKRSHHSCLLKALCIPNVCDVLTKRALSLYHRVFQVDSPCRDLCLEMLCRYLTDGKVIGGTLLHKVIQAGYSPIHTAFYKEHFKCNVIEENGIVDSLKNLICNENFMSPYSDEHLLVTLFTRAF